MQCVIDFAYTSNCKITESNVIPLIATAEYLGFPPLIDQCAQFVLSILNVNNCISLLTKIRFGWSKYLKYRQELDRSFSLPLK